MRASRSQIAPQPLARVAQHRQQRARCRRWSDPAVGTGLSWPRPAEHLDRLAAAAGEGRCGFNFARRPTDLLMVATDPAERLRRRGGEPIPERDPDRMALFWFEQLADIVRTTSPRRDPERRRTVERGNQVRQACDAGPPPAPLRWKPSCAATWPAADGRIDCQASGTVCGVPLPPGLRNAEAAGADLHAADQGQAGAHDNITERMCVRDRRSRTRQRVLACSLASIGEPPGSRSKRRHRHRRHRSSGSGWTPRAR